MSSSHYDLAADVTLPDHDGWPGRRRTVLLIAVACLLALFSVLPLGIRSGILHSDGVAYYAYLPAALIERDLTFERAAERHFNGAFPVGSGIERYGPTGLYLNKYPIGVALLQLPFFAIAHGISLLAGLPATGYGAIYHLAAGIAGACYTLLGLAILGELLARHFTDRVSSATLAYIFFGTSLLNYGAFEATMSHAYSFFLVAALLALTPRWYAEPSVGHSALLGLVAGLIVVTRIPNALFLLIVPLYGLRDRATIIGRFQLYRARLPALAVVVAVGCLVLAPQLAYWHHITGRWLIYSYQGEGFDFARPRLFAALFSTQRGLFFWSPLLLLAAAGWWPLRRVAPNYLPGTLIVLALVTYLIASWDNWQYGWGFGHRVFVDSLSIFALGLGALLAALRGPAARLVWLLGALFAAVSVVQTLQYQLGILPKVDVTWDVYWSAFLRLW